LDDGTLAKAARSPGCAASTAPATEPPATEPDVVIDPDEKPAAAATAGKEGTTTTEGSATTEGGATTEATATSAANKPGATATMESGAAAAMATTTTAAVAAPATAAAMAAPTTTASATGQLHAAAKVFPVEEMERGQADVGHFLFAKNEALIGRRIARLRDTGSGRRGCGCTTCQRKTQSGGTQHLHGAGFGCAFPFRSLLDPWHGRILRI
jgi:hypothetical protein